MTQPVERKRAHLNQAPDERTLAKYTAARVFLAGMWAGALLMIGSFTQLYWFTFARPAASPALVSVLGVALLVLGAWAFWRNRLYYQDLEFPFRKKWATVADIIALSGAVFWLLLIFLLVLTALGVSVLPD